MPELVEAESERQLFDLSEAIGTAAVLEMAGLGALGTGANRIVGGIDDCSSDISPLTADFAADIRGKF